MAQNDELIEPTLLFSILCDDVRREDNGKFILIGLFETIGAKKFPATHPVLYIINCWIGGLGAFKQKSRIINKNGDVLAKDKETTFSLKDLTDKHRIIARFNNLKFDMPGEYSVEVLLNGELKVRYPLLIKKMTQPVNT
jgi:hypothetical protein